MARSFDASLSVIAALTRKILKSTDEIGIIPAYSFARNWDFWRDKPCSLDRMIGFGHKLKGNYMTKRLFAVFVSVCAILFGFLKPAFATVTLGVSPSAVSNTYDGFITLNIAGLTNGEQVTIQKYMDLNGNGSVDPGEPLMDSFKIADGGAMLIGGVTNISVPYDSNPAVGAITTILNFSSLVTLENVVGSYVYQVVSPTGRFQPVTATFAVTNATLGQSVSGTVYNNGSPVPHAVVVLQDQQANNPAGGVVADVNGHYFLTLPPSSYNLIGTAPGSYYGFDTAPSVVLTNGMSVTNDLFLTNGGPTTISGTIYNTGNSNGVAGLLLTMSSGSLFSVAFTDTNGNYSAALTPSFWTIQVEKQRLSRRAFVNPEAKFQVDATGGSVTNANLGLPKGNALFYGRVTDNHGAPFANVQVDGSVGNVYDAKAYTDANGYYAVAVLGDQTNQWSCNVNSGKGTALANYVLNFADTTTLTTNQAILENFIALPAIGVISGRVLDNASNPVAGVTLSGTAVIGGANYQTLDGTTDNTGFYSLTVAAGHWDVEFFTGGFSDDLDSKGLVDLSAPHIEDIPPTNVVMNLTVYPFGTPSITFPQRMSSTQFGLTINGASNVNYTLQVSTNLAFTNWTSLFSLTLTNTAVPVVDPNATNSPRFYRVRKN